MLTMTWWGNLALAQGQLNSTFPSNISTFFDFGDGTITDIQEDWNGFIWLSTTDGLYRFDGTEVKAYKSNLDSLIPHSLVYSLLVDTVEEVIWLGTRGGLCKLNPGTEKSTIYITNPNDSSSLADDLVRRVVKDRSGRIWVSTFNRGICLLDQSNGRFENFFFEYEGIDILHEMDPQINLSGLNSYTAMVQDVVDEDILWLGSPFGLVSFNMRLKSFEWIDAPLIDFDKVTPDNPIVELYATEKYLVVGHTQGAYLLRRDDFTVTRLNEEEPARSLFRTTKIREQDGDIHVSFRNGALQIDTTGQVVQVLEDQLELEQTYGVLLHDSQDRSWIYSSGKLKLYHNFDRDVNGYLLPEDFRGTPVITKAVNENTVLQITDSKTSFAVFNVANRKWTIRDFRGEIDKVSGGWQDFLSTTDGGYLLSRDKLFKFEYETGFLLEVPIDHTFTRPRFRKILADDRGFLWIGSIDHGLIRLDVEGGLSKHYAQEFNSSTNSSLYTWITDLMLDQEARIWIRLGRSFSVYVPDDHFIQFPITDYHGRTFKYIRNFAEDSKGNVWISSEDEGVGAVEPDISKGIGHFVTVNEGLSSNNISHIAFGPDDNLWVLSDVGLDRLDPQTLEIKSIPWSMGIPRASTFFFLPDGTIVLPWAIGGIALFDPLMLETNLPIPTPYLTRLRVRNRIIFQGNRPDLSKINIKTERDFLAFEFSALGFINPKEFSYKLDDVDSDWVYTTERQTAMYTNLKPGEYNFFLRARNVGGDWSNEKTIAVDLIPFWWETYWFKGFLIWLILIALYLFYRWRLQSLRQEDKIKSDFQQRLNDIEMQALRSQMNPHFLFNSLNSIQHFIIKNKTKEAVDYLNRFSRLVRLILMHSRVKKVSLKEELDALRLYLDLENLRFKNKFTYEINIDPEINENDIEIPPMLIQPFVENAIWHGLLHKEEAGIIKIVVKIQDEKLICTIEDNGIGRKASAAIKARSNRHRKSMGMSITRSRLDIINHEVEGAASIHIEDLAVEEYGTSGTRVQINLPVNS